MAAVWIQHALAPRNREVSRTPRALLHDALAIARRAACALRGHRHQMRLHFEPSRLSLRCPSCGAETHGWEITIDPRFRSIRKPIVRRESRAGSRAA
jgi:hypothetical protein